VFLYRYDRIPRSLWYHGFSGPRCLRKELYGRVRTDPIIHKNHLISSQVILYHLGSIIWCKETSQDSRKVLCIVFWSDMISSDVISYAVYLFFIWRREVISLIFLISWYVVSYSRLHSRLHMSVISYNVPSYLHSALYGRVRLCRTDPNIHNYHSMLSLKSFTMTLVPSCDVRKYH
jgi:hypothetical protein